MTASLYKVVSGVYTELSDYVLNISGFTFRRDRSFYPTIPHPTITFDDTVSLSEGDELEIWIDSSLEMVLYVNKIAPNPDKFTFDAECYDLIKKLDKFYISNILPSDFDTTSYWTGLSSQEQQELYKYVSGGSSYYDEQYIQALFLARVMIHNACNIDLEDITDSYVKDYTTNWLKYKSTSGATPALLARKYILFQWKQLKAIGLSKSADPFYDGATFLDVFLEICRTLRIRWEWTIVSETRTLRFSYISAFNIPSADLDGYRAKKMDTVDSLQAQVAKLSSLTDYYATFTESPVSEFTKPTNTGNFTKRSITLPKHFVLHYRPSASYLLREISFNDNTEFLEQFATAYADFYNTAYNQIDIVLSGTAEKDALVNNIDFKSGNSKITHYEEVR